MIAGMTLNQQKRCERLQTLMAVCYQCELENLDKAAYVLYGMGFKYLFSQS